MEEPKSNVTPKWFWIVSAIALVWNLIGLAMFGMMMSISGNKEAMDASLLNEEQQALINATPSWVNVAFAAAVVFGVLGCIALLCKKKLAIPLLILSLIGVIAQNVYVFFLSNSVEVMGIGAAPLVILISIALVPYAMQCAKKNWFG